MIGRLALKHSLIREGDLKQALQVCADAEDPEKALVDYLVANELVSSRDIDRLSKASKAVRMRQKTIRLGGIAIEKGFVSEKQLKTALDDQKRQLKINKRSMLLGDILVERGFVTEKQRDELLLEQKRLQEAAAAVQAKPNVEEKRQLKTAAGTDSRHAVQVEHFPLLGKLALKHSLVKKEDLKGALQALSGAKDPDKALADYLTNHDLVDPLDVQRLVKASRAIAMRQKDIKFGALAVAKGLVTEKLLQIALDEQRKIFKKKKHSKLIGDILVDAAIISLEQRNDILEEQDRLKEIRQENVGSKNPDDPGTSANGQPSDNIEMLNSEMVMGGMLLSVTKDKYAAYLTKTEVFNENITLGDVKGVLDQKQIVAGVVSDELIEGFIASRAFKKKPFKIAKGIEPVPGKDAVINYFFDANRLRAGKIDRSGAIDFRERGKIPQVDKGALLAEKIPAVEPMAGTTIFADTVKMPPVKDSRLKPDKGAVFDESGLKIMAAMGGQPVISLSGVVSVFDVFETPGDIGFETGHVDYDGNVNVKGCIKTDFRVTANIVKANEIDGGIVNAEADVIVSGGISNARIYSKGSVSAKFILKSEILCMGDVEVSQEIIDAKIHNSGACIIKRGSIIGSEIVSYMGVYAGSIGTDRSRPSSITSGRDIFVKETLAFIQKKITDKKSRISRIGKRADELNEKKVSESQKRQEISAVKTKILEKKNGILVEISTLDKEKNVAEIKSLSLISASLEKSIATREKELESCKQELLNLDRRISRLMIGLGSQQETLEDLLAEQKAFTGWVNINSGIALIEVSGKLKAGTRVAGKHTAKQIQKTVNGATIKEYSESSDDNIKGCWKVQVIPE